MPATISVVIPVKDDAELLARCLRALAGQTEPAHEIVVVDNGSADDTAAVARAGGARVVPFAGRGIPAAAAAGYDVAAGDVIARLDADCLPSPTWIATIRTVLDHEPGTDAITGGAHFIDGPVRLRRWLAVGYLGAYYAVTRPLLGHPALFGSNMAMRRTAWEAVRFVVHRRDPIVHDDLDLSYHLGERHRIRYESGMRMGISMRPFTDGRALALRVARGWYTVLVHLPYGGAPWRWIRRARRALLPRDPAPAPIPPTVPDALVGDSAPRRRAGSVP